MTSCYFNATILKFSEKFDHQFLHVFIFGNMFPVSDGFVAVKVKMSNNFRPPSQIRQGQIRTISSIQLVTGIATKLTLRKHVTQYKNIQKLMVEFLRKCESRAIKISLVNPILITKSINSLHFCTVLESAHWENSLHFLHVRHFCSCACAFCACVSPNCINHLQNAFPKCILLHFIFLALTHTHTHGTSLLWNRPFSHRPCKPKETILKEFNLW